MRPRGGTNIGAGLQVAASVAIRYPTQDGAIPKLVVVSDGVSGLSENQVVAIEEFISRLSGQGLQLTVIDLSDGDTEHPLLSRLAAAAGGSILKAQSTEEIQWALVETLTGSSSVVASDAVLEVNFNPRTVAAYRLVGHAPALAGLMPQGAETPFRCRQAATALFELWLRSDADDDVAMAEVTWRDPVSGEPRKQRQRISLVQFAPSLAEAPLSLQAATIAAETAEVLGQSHFVASPTRGLKDVIAVAREVHPRLAERPSFERFVTFVEQAERARTRRVSRGG
jgi:Ca-activated chloride channel family protein